MKDFEQLKHIHVDSVKKQRDFERVTARLDKPMLPWQIPLVLLGVVMLSFFLLLTWSEPREIVADTEPELTAVYRLYGEGNPYSIWQMWVTRSTDFAVLAEYSAVLQDAQRVKAFSLDSDVSDTYRFVYSDGTAVKYESYYQNGQSYWYDVDNALYYEITDRDRYYKIPMMDDYSDAKNYLPWIITALVLYLLPSYFIERKMRDAHDKKRRLPQHSTHWQTIVNASAFAIIVVLALVVPNLHYAAAVLILTGSTAINVLLERKFGQNGWRMLHFVVNGYWFMLTLITLFLT